MRSGFACSSGSAGGSATPSTRTRAGPSSRRRSSARRSAARCSTGSADPLRPSLPGREQGGVVVGGKAIVGGLIGGLVGGELEKRWAGLTRRTGDLFAMPLALGIAIGRIGCFLSGLPDRTYGTPSSLPWAVDFGDGIPRHPTQLYESAVMAVAAVALGRLTWRPHPPGDAFRLF